MYYSCEWEQIIHKSSNASENVQLMKVITLAIAINCRAYCLTGLNYFRVTLVAVLKVSYLTI